MKKKNATYMLAGGLVVTSSLLAGCIGPVPTVYGPPPDALFTPEINIPEAVYGPPPDTLFSPEINIPEDVYGPPQDFGYDENPDGEVDGEDATPAPDFDPADNLPAPVYGPPGGF